MDIQDLRDDIAVLRLTITAINSVETKRALQRELRILQAQLHQQLRQTQQQRRVQRGLRPAPQPVCDFHRGIAGARPCGLPH